MEIRQLKAADAVKNRMLRLEALQNKPEAFSASYEEELAYPIETYIDRLDSETSFTFGAFEGEELFGIATLVKESRAKLKHRSSIVGMYVSHKKRGLGAGRKLMEAAIGKAKELESIEQIHLCVISENEPARRLYDSLGFEVYGTDKHAMKIGDHYYDEEHRILFL
ncbi:MAG TPA: GNAT family N-acetyltransferase [Bacillales bacterium]|nr:GNAT family N-acetyltransferase [Bacillales bacterium]